jgi:phosphoglycolate phosphatase-like HAD superfamily hydrolase
MSLGLIFDLDQTLLDTSAAEQLRKNREWNSVYRKISDFTLYAGMREVFDFIHDTKIPYAIVTSSPKTYCVKVCNQWGFDSSLCVCYHDTPYDQKKPHPAPIRLGIQKLQVDPKRILSFGDRDIDIIASKEAGVISVACLWGADEKEKILSCNPDFILKDVEEITPLIQKHL